LRKTGQNGKNGFNGLLTPRPIATGVNQTSIPKNNLAELFHVISRTPKDEGRIARRDEIISPLGKFAACDLLRHSEPHFHASDIQRNTLRFGRALA